MRTAEISRKTAETDVKLALNLDGTGMGEIKTGVGFLDHMLTLFARHARVDLSVSCQGDTWVDDHHSVEDIGICLGLALKDALGEKRGITRYGDIALPMDETLMICALDVSGRGGLFMAVSYPTEKIGAFDTQLVKEFMDALAKNAGLTLHFNMRAGENAHHIAEAQFKSLARALKQAVAVDPALAGEVPSTKGVLS